MEIKNPTAKKAIKIATIGGASILAINAAMSLMKVKSIKEGVMPVVTILVAVTAFACATAVTTTQTPQATKN